VGQGLSETHARQAEATGPTPSHAWPAEGANQQPAPPSAAIALAPSTIGVELIDASLVR
jgi:hypothetical protein